jgi:hypothetical protein
MEQLTSFNFEQSNFVVVLHYLKKENQVISTRVGTSTITWSPLTSLAYRQHQVVFQF